MQDLGNQHGDTDQHASDSALANARPLASVDHQEAVESIGQEAVRDGMLLLHTVQFCCKIDPLVILERLDKRESYLFKNDLSGTFILPLDT